MSERLKSCAVFHALFASLILFSSVSLVSFLYWWQRRIQQYYPISLLCLPVIRTASISHIKKWLRRDHEWYQVMSICIWLLQTSYPLFPLFFLFIHTRRQNNMVYYKKTKKVSSQRVCISRYYVDLSTIGTTYGQVCSGKDFDEIDYFP